MQLTLWGPQNGTLTDYAYKLWNGLIGSCCYQRWDQWVGAVTGAMQQSQAFNQTEFVDKLQSWEESWVHQQGNPYLQQPVGDGYMLAQTIYNKYFA